MYTGKVIAAFVDFLIGVGVGLIMPGASMMSGGFDIAVWTGVAAFFERFARDFFGAGAFAVLVLGVFDLAREEEVEAM